MTNAPTVRLSLPSDIVSVIADSLASTGVRVSVQLELPDLIAGLKEAKYADTRLDSTGLVAQIGAALAPDMADQIATLTRERDEARSEAELTRNGWKDMAEAPHAHRGMRVSLRGFIGRVSKYLDRKDQGGDGYQLREIQRHLCEVWKHRGEPGIVAEFGALYCLDKDGPIEEPEDDDITTPTQGAQA
jgi:hypothetical protein